MKNKGLIILGVGVLGYILWKKNKDAKAFVSTTPTSAIDRALMTLEECEKVADNMTFSSDEERELYTDDCMDSYSGMVGTMESEGGRLSRSTWSYSGMVGKMETEGGRLSRSTWSNIGGVKLRAKLTKKCMRKRNQGKPWCEGIGMTDPNSGVGSGVTVSSTPRPLGKIDTILQGDTPLMGKIGGVQTCQCPSDRPDFYYTSFKCPCGTPPSWTKK